MLYSAHPPCAALRDFVDYFWSLRDAPGHARERIVPSGTIELVFNLHEDGFRIYDPVTAKDRRFRGAIASGCYSRAFEIESRAHADVLGAHFKPGGAARLLGAPAGELSDAHVGLEDLWGGRASELREQLCETSSVARRIELVERQLMERWSERSYPRPAARAGLSELDLPGVEVGHVVTKLGVSRRRFIEVFTEDVGMTPKRYSMVRRLQRALASVERGSPPAWSQIAADCGYSDQAHLCRDWAELTGLSPNEFLASRSVEVKEHHVALPPEGVKSVQYGGIPRT